MTLQSSGAISLADVQTEFGGANPIGINEYYGVAAGVPASGTISLYDFYGKSAGFAFTSNIFGYSSIYSLYVTSSTYDGNIVTPGAASSPKTFYIIASPENSGYSAGASANLSYYQGGSLNTVWTFVGTYYTFNFGASSMQFRSSCSDTNSFDNTLSYTSVYTFDGGGRNLYYHAHNFGGAGYSD